METAQLEEERRRREELEAIKDEYQNLLDEEKRARQFEEQVSFSFNCLDPLYYFLQYTP